MERYAAGDDAAFGEIYDLLAPRLYGYLLRRVRCTAHAEDLLQQTLLNVHRGRSSFIPGADLMPWVFAIARRLVIDGARLAKRQVELAGEEASSGAISRTDAADEVVSGKQLASRLERELARLPEAQRMAFELLKQDGLSLAEAAEVLGTTVGAVKLRLHRANEALRAVLDEEGPR